MVIEEMDEHPANASTPMDVIVFGMMTVWSKSKVELFRYFLNASTAIEVNVSGIVQEVPSSERRFLASDLVKAGILGEERMEKLY